MVFVTESLTRLTLHMRYWEGSPRIYASLMEFLGRKYHHSLYDMVFCKGKTHTFGIKYKILNRVEKTLSMMYSILSRVTSIYIIRYEILQRITKNLNMKYEILERVTKNSRILYEIIGEGSFNYNYKI